MISSNFLKVESQHTVKLEVKDLTVTVASSTKSKDLESNGGLKTRILDDVSFDLDAGSLMAIMGGSGSGKTTLLNTLSQRLNHTNKGLQFEGSINYVGPDGSSHNYVKNAYMLQTDVFLPGLTVLETLQFQADLRMPQGTPSQDKAALIESLFEILELQSARDQVICSFTSHTSNLSGGEQRRVTLAIQLLSKPAILFLDEPTTGLDTSSSLKLVQTLRKLASSEFNVTIIMSIHQPRPQISVMFDKICLLTRGGRMVYYGNLVDSWTYFQQLDFLAANNNTGNILEYIMDLSVKDTSSKAEEKTSAERIDKLVAKWRQVDNHQAGKEYVILSGKQLSKKLDQNLKSFSANKESRVSLWREIEILTRRTFLLTWRDKASLIGLNGGSVLLACITGWMFYKPKHDLAGLRTITSVLYVMLEVVGFCPMFLEVERLWMTDIIFFYREYRENFVSITGFLISRRLGKLLLEDLPFPMIFSAISYWMVGLRQENVSFWIYLVVAVLIQFIGMASALLVVVISSDFAISSAVINCFYQLQNSACGYFINAATMPVYVRWTKYIAYFWYAFGALTSNQYTDWMGDCPYDDPDMCIEFSGNYQLDVLGYPQHWRTVPIVILLAWFVGIQILAGAGLYWKNSDMRIAKTKTNKIGGEEDEEQEEDKEIQEITENGEGVPDNALVGPEKLKNVLSSGWCQDGSESDSIDISLERISLDVMLKDPSNKFNLFAKNTIPKTLLHEISATFKANTVNAIMGPSGSGKTTLLNFLSSRLSKASQYEQREGSILFNASQNITRSELAHISAYVTQHDTALIANLTVRETLYYQARLRLPVSEHPGIPTIIGSLIRKMGLGDCAETLIGNESRKGISGGEKRRVSIAIQLLSRPKILFLDEPTSGLDSSTAASILTLLNEVARESKSTIITTIHQPSEEIFLQFSNVLLLARGGRVAYNGASTAVMDYFSSIGFFCPKETNIADYFLDLVSQGLDEEISVSQARVAGLVHQWKDRATMIKPLSEKFGEESPSALSQMIDIRKYEHTRLPLSTTFPTIASRQLLNSLRSKDVLFARAFQTTLLAIIHAIYFSPLKDTQEGVANRLGLVQEVMNLYFVGLVNNLSLFPIERDLFFQEYQDSIYGVTEFSTAYLINELPMEIIPCLFFSIMIVFVVGLPRTVAMFFSMFLTTFVSINCGESLGIFVNSVFEHLGLATNILTITIIFAIFMGGTMSLHMPMFFQAWNYINPMKYAVGICAVLGFEDQKFTCSHTGGVCLLNSGESVLDYYNLNVNLGAFFGGLVACLIMYRIIATAALYIKVTYRN
ncbi:hypothetical protein CAAN1_10S00738 [[Candida] anglica]|uniref:ABC transporter domain-containing protein n=1 Tax=[Candida] anglica TaxID=148631 RepID=A0ABP0EE98_9ASCO